MDSFAAIVKTEPKSESEYEASDCEDESNTADLNFPLKIDSETLISSSSSSSGLRLPIKKESVKNCVDGDPVELCGLLFPHKSTRKRRLPFKVAEGIGSSSKLKVCKSEISESSEKPIVSSKCSSSQRAGSRQSFESLDESWQKAWLQAQTKKLSQETEKCAASQVSTSYSETQAAKVQLTPQIWNRARRCVVARCSNMLAPGKELFRSDEDSRRIQKSSAVYHLKWFQQFKDQLDYTHFYFCAKHHQELTIGHESLVTLYPDAASAPLSPVRSHCHFCYRKLHFARSKCEAHLVFLTIHGKQHELVLPCDNRAQIDKCVRTLESRQNGALETMIYACGNCEDSVFVRAADKSNNSKLSTSGAMRRLKPHAYEILNE